MAKKDSWLAYETSTTTGTGSYQLSGEAFVAPNVVTTLFANVLVDGDQTVYVAHGDGSNFEVNLGTWTAATNELTRDQRLFTTNGGQPVNWATGTKSIYAIQDPILTSAFLRSANNLSEIDDEATAQNNLGLGTMALETATNFVDKRVNDQTINGTILRIRGAGPNRFAAEESASGPGAWYGFRVNVDGPDQGVIAHHDGVTEVDVMRFDHEVLDFFSNPQNVDGMDGAVAYLRAGLSSDQTTGLTVGSPIKFDTVLDSNDITSIALNTNNGTFGVTAGNWFAFLQVRILFNQDDLGVFQTHIVDIPGNGQLSSVITTRAPNEPFAEGPSDTTTGIINVPGSPKQFIARIANVGGVGIQAIMSGFTQMTVIGLRGNS